jgi:L-alanine-DL-glutamate epimerase-like enolase superfamily enzyme
VKITNIERIDISIPLVKPFTHFSGRVTDVSTTSIVLVHTDERITGIGNAEPNFDAELAERLLSGCDPLEIEKTMEAMEWNRSAGVEIALWDILGKVAKQPIYKLLGACRDKIKAYVSMLSLKTAEEQARLAIAYLDDGFTAIKLRLHRPNLADDLAVIQAVRDAVGDEMEIMTDANQARMPFGPLHWTLSTAQRAARELERMDVVWLEEPLNALNTEGYRRLAESVDIPIAGGEGVTELERFNEMLLSGGWDIIQPDVIRIGGILPTWKAAHLAEAHHRLCILAHVRWPGLQLLGAIPNCTHFEWMHDPPRLQTMFGEKILQNPIEIKDGYVTIPNDPGLGITLNEEGITRYRVKESALRR